MIRDYRFMFAATVALVYAVPAMAVPTLPNVFGNHMVLQKETTVPVWGWADPNEEITVELFEQVTEDATEDSASFKQVQELQTIADADGNWEVNLDPVLAGDKYMLSVTGKERVRFQDVRFGEVWLASGQSNMEWPVSQARDAQLEIAQAHYSDIRFFTAKHSTAGEAQKDVEGEWVVVSPESVGALSAVGYFFARYLHQEVDAPVGIIDASWGGTPVESWTSRTALEAADQTTGVLAREAQFAAEHPHRPAVLYNGMIAPIIPYAIKGAIWYQGESNAGRAYQYRELFPAMIGDWRTRWGQDFPFLFVQLANFQERLDKPAESEWAELREAQLMTMHNVPNTAMASAIDIGEAADIHPKNKQEVGRRLGLAALALAYARDITYSGPLYRDMAIENDKIRINFDHVGGGLQASGPLNGFTIAGPDHVFVPAEARIEGESVVVSAPGIEHPVAVRYAWADNPETGLYNRAGLPASPFRTDDWEGKTFGKK